MEQDGRVVGDDWWKKGVLMPVVGSSQRCSFTSSLLRQTFWPDTENESLGNLEEGWAE